MKSSYKVALVIAVALCLIVVIYYANQDDPAGGEAPIRNQPGQTAQVEAPPPPQDDSPPDRPSLIDKKKAPAPATGRETDLTALIKKHLDTANLPEPDAEPVPVPELRLDGEDKTKTTEPPSTAPPETPETPAPPETPTPPEAPSTLTPVTALPPAPSTRKEPTHHTIAPGDTFGKIAAHYFGHERYWVQIAQANPRLDPQGLQVGQVIRLPDLETINRKRSDEPAAAAPAGTISYKVRPGDTLSSIAEAHYDGDANQWRYLYNANRKKIGPDPGRIKAGMVLTIPPLPKVAK